MRWLITVLVVLIVGLQFRLWVGEGSLAQKVELQRAIEQISEENARLKLRNEQLAKEVEALKAGPEGIEGKAREDLGMIKEGETFYMIVEPKKQLKEQSKVQPPGLPVVKSAEPAKDIPPEAPSLDVSTQEQSEKINLPKNNPTKNTNHEADKE